MKVRKAVIPCGGLGTRFLPITKAVAKEMLPIIDKPCVDYIVDELIESGIEDILIILSPGKDIIRQYFSENKALYERLEADTKKTHILESLKRIDTKARISFVLQEKPNGSGDAVLRAEEFVGGEPFVLALGDDIMYSDGEPVSKQLIDKYAQYGKIILGVQERDVPEILNYGVVDKLRDLTDDVCEMRGIMEKPKEEELTSKLAGLGRYVITPDIFDYIRKTAYKNNELQLTDTLNTMAREGKVFAYIFKARRYDLGDKFGSIQAMVEFGLRNKDFGEQLRLYLKELCEGM